MTTMKKSLFFVLALMVSVFVTSCNKESVDALSEDLTEMVQLSAARVSAAGDTVTKQKCKGKLTEITAASLPANVTSYISTNFAGAEIQFAGKDEKGMMVVGLKLADGTHKGLLFNADGTFNKALEKYHRGAKLTKVETSALPASITDYISKTYAGYTIKHAGKNADGAYFVMITSGDTRKVVQFDATGKFTQEMTPPAHPEGKGKRKKN
jgi:hypothetical protein